MRLLVVTNDYPPKPGGIQQYLGNLVAHYPFPVRVLGPATGRDPAAEPGVRRHRRRFMWPTPGVARWIDREFDDFGPDAVLFGAPLPLAMLGRRLARRGVPVGVLCHGAEVTVPAAVPGLRAVLRRTLRSTDVRFAVSRFTAARVQNLTRLPTHYVGAGVDVEMFTPGDRSPSSGTPVVGCVSRFVPRKGQHRLIEAAAELRRRGTPIELRLVGRGRMERRLRRRAARSSVAVRFDIAVPWQELPGLYRSFDVFAMPCRSRWAGLEVEGLGLVYLEAAACGLPVVAGDSGGAPETVLPGRSGYIASSPEGVADAVERILAGPDHGRRMGRAGREMVVSRFVWPEVVARFIAGFEGAIDRPS